MKALLRVSTTMLDSALQNSVVDNRLFGFFSEMAAYKPRKATRPWVLSWWQHTQKRLHGHRYRHMQNSVVNNNGFG